MEDDKDPLRGCFCDGCRMFRECRLEIGATADDPACWDFIPADFFE
jgi:hypothetical protein